MISRQKKQQIMKTAKNNADIFNNVEEVMSFGKSVKEKFPHIDPIEFMQSEAAIESLVFPIDVIAWHPMKEDK